MNIRPAQPGDLPALLEIFAHARAFMAQTGNPTQWPATYPGAELMQQQIARGVCYVLEGNARPEATFCYIPGPEPTYAEIYDGGWPDDAPYATIHRMASAGRVHGAAAICFAWCAARGLPLRADTHADNKVMQHLLEKNGFVRCGNITLADGTYQLYTCSLKDRTDGKTETLALHQTEDTRETQKLPAFAYTGNDKIMKTLCDYMCSQDYGYSGEVYIPAPVVYKTVEEDDGVVVFANLWSFTYNPNGNTLDCEGGGEQPSRLKLKPDKKGGYTVQEHLEAGDGAEYQKDIEAFCNGYPVAVSKFTEEGKNYEKIRKELVMMYVDDHGLDFKYYKDYGWDPVSL